MSYLAYWSLHRKPFALDPKSYFFTGVPQREAVAGLNYFAASDWNLAFLVAPRRCGMTALLQHVVTMNGLGDCAVESIMTPGDLSDREAVVSALANSLGFNSGSGDADLHVSQAIEASERQGLQTVWMIDQCHEPAVSLARELVVAHSSLSIVIGTTPQDHPRNTIQFGQLGMQVDLSPLTPDDTMRYARQCVLQAGASQSLFSDSAAIRLHEVTGGALRDLAIVAESALSLAASHRLDQVSSAIIEAIAEQVRRAA